jgi:hypothetical protein
VSFATFVSNYTPDLSVVMVYLSYVACLAIVAVESFVISPLILLKINLSSIEVYAVYIHYINMLRFITLVAVVVVITFTSLFYAHLVDRQLIDHLDRNGEVTMV